VAVASAGPYANHLHLVPDSQHLITEFFIGWMLFLTLNQQCQSTEGNNNWQKTLFISGKEIQNRIHTQHSNEELK